MLPPPFPFPDKWPALFQQQHHHHRGGAAQWLTPYTQIMHHAAGAVSSMAMPPPEQTAPVAHVHTFAPSDTWWDGQVDQDAADTVEDEDLDDGDDDYEYGYVLDDQWLQYLKDDVLSNEDSGTSSAPTKHNSHQSRDKTSTQPKRSRGGKKHQPAIVRRMPNQLELVLDEARLLERQRRRGRFVTKTEESNGEAFSRVHPTHVVASSGSGRVWDPSGETSRSSLQVVERHETALHLRFEEFCDTHSPAVWPQGAS